MEEQQKLKELIIQVKRKNPEIKDDQCVKEIMVEFTKWRPFFDEELEYWRGKAKELVENFT